MQFCKTKKLDLKTEAKEGADNRRAMVPVELVV